MSNFTNFKSTALAMFAQCHLANVGRSSAADLSFVNAPSVPHTTKRGNLQLSCCWRALLTPQMCPAPPSKAICNLPTACRKWKQTQVHVYNMRHTLQWVCSRVENSTTGKQSTTTTTIHTHTCRHTNACTHMHPPAPTDTCTHTHTLTLSIQLTSKPDKSEYFLAGLKDGGPSMDPSVRKRITISRKEILSSSKCWWLSSTKYLVLLTRWKKKKHSHM